VRANQHEHCASASFITDDLASSFHRIVARVHACGEGALKSVEAFGMSEFGLLLFFLLLFRYLCSSLLLLCRVGLALRHPTAHSSGDGTSARAFASVTGNGTNGGTARRPTCSTGNSATLRFVHILGSGFLLGLFLFRSLARGCGSLRIDSGLLLRGTVAIRFVFQLLVRALTILSKYENADVLRGGSSWRRRSCLVRRRCGLLGVNYGSPACTYKKNCDQAIVVEQMHKQIASGLTAVGEPNSEAKWPFRLSCYWLDPPKIQAISYTGAVFRMSRLTHD
jgi:hypothetical protein